MVFKAISCPVFYVWVADAPYSTHLMTVIDNSENHVTK